MTGAKCTMTDIATGSAVKPANLTLDQISAVYMPRRILVPDQREKDRIQYISWSLGEPRVLQMNAVNALEGEPCVLYEIHYRDGSVEWLEDEYR